MVLPFANYQGDNGIYKSSQIHKESQQQRANIKYSEVRVNHQNGIAKRVICTILCKGNVIACHDSLT